MHEHKYTILSLREKAQNYLHSAKSGLLKIILEISNEDSWMVQEIRFKNFSFFFFTCENTAEEGGYQKSLYLPFEASEIVWKKDLCLSTEFPPRPLEKSQQTE